MIEVAATGPAHRWMARDHAEIIGRAVASTRPDQRCFVVFEDCQQSAYQPLLEAAATALNRKLYVEVDAADQDTRARLEKLGFVVARQEQHYRIPTDLTRLRMDAVAGVPPGFKMISAADADLQRLKALDETLRDDVPGADGWRWQLDEFRAETFDPSQFDPATYLVAVQRSSGAYVGLIRIWANPQCPRLGLIGVLPQLRRTRLTIAMGAAAFGVLNERGHAEVSAEVDITNRGANLGLRKLGARWVGSAFELVR